MTQPWSAPRVPRPEPCRLTGEREVLEQWVDYHRSTLLRKCAGLTAEQLKRHAVPISRLTLLGLVRHLTEVERWWFRLNADGEPDLPDVYCTEQNPEAYFHDLADADTDLAALPTGMRDGPGIGPGP